MEQTMSNVNTKVACSKCSKAYSWLEKYADHPSAFLTLNADTQHFFLPNIDGFIAYVDDGACYYQIGGVVAHRQTQSLLLDAFLTQARERRRRVCCVQVRKEQVELYETHGFTINQMGLSYSLSLVDFTIEGTAFSKLRNKLRRAEKSGLSIIEYEPSAALSDDVACQIKAITNEWLETKGSDKLLQFMVGDMSDEHARQRRIFAACQDDRVVAFSTFVPAYGTYSGFMHDLSRRSKASPPGAMELINVAAIKKFKSEGVPYLNFGLTPFCGVDNQFDTTRTRSAFLHYFFKFLEKYGQSLYPAISQVQYKRKWQPIVETPEYIAFHGGFKWSYFLGLLKITQSI